MKKLLIISVLLLSLVSCVPTRQYIDNVYEGVFIQIKDVKYQVYVCGEKTHYIIKTDCYGRTYRQRVYLGL